MMTMNILPPQQQPASNLLGRKTPTNVNNGVSSVPPSSQEISATSRPQPIPIPRQSINYEVVNATGGSCRYETLGRKDANGITSNNLPPNGNGVTSDLRIVPTDGRISKLRDIQRTPLPLPPVTASAVTTASPNVSIPPLHSIHNHHVYSNHQAILAGASSTSPPQSQVQPQVPLQSPRLRQQQLDVPQKAFEGQKHHTCYTSTTHHHHVHTAQPNHHRHRNQVHPEDQILLPSQSRRKTPSQKSLHAFLPVCDMLFNVLSLAGYICDVFFDLVVIHNLYTSGDDNRHRRWWSPMITCITISSVTCQYLSYIWYSQERKMFGEDASDKMLLVPGQEPEKREVQQEGNPIPPKEERENPVTSGGVGSSHECPNYDFPPRPRPRRKKKSRGGGNPLGSRGGAADLYTIDNDDEDSGHEEDPTTTNNEEEGDPQEDSSSHYYQNRHRRRGQPASSAGHRRRRVRRKKKLSLATSSNSPSSSTSSNNNPPCDTSDDKNNVSSSSSNNQNRVTTLSSSNVKSSSSVVDPDGGRDQVAQSGETTTKTTISKDTWKSPRILTEFSNCPSSSSKSFSPASLPILSLHILQVGILWRYCLLFLPVNLLTVKMAVRDLCMLRMVHAFIQAGPMLLMQVYIMFTKTYRDEISDIDVISTILSGFSVCWALASFSKNVLRRNVHKLVLTWLGVIFQFAWRVGTISSRAVALTVYATIYHEVTLVVIFLHWISMSVCVHLFGHDEEEERDTNEESTTRKKDYKDKTLAAKYLSLARIAESVMVGWIYILCYINLSENNSRPRMLAYYLTMFCENSLLGILSLGKVRGLWFHDLSVLLIWGGFSMGIISLLLYYQFFHTKYIKELQFLSCPDHNPHAILTAHRQSQLMNGAISLSDHHNRSPNELTSHDSSCGLPRIPSQLPVGVFSCRLNPVMTKRKKKKPSTFVPPPSTSTCPPPQSEDFQDRSPIRWTAGDRLQQRLVINPSRSSIPAEFFTVQYVRPSAHHRLPRQGLQRRYVQSASLFSHYNQVNGNDLELVETIDNLRQYRTQPRPSGNQSLSTTQVKTTRPVVQVVAPHVRSQPNLLESVARDSANSTNVDDIQKQLELISDSRQNVRSPTIESSEGRVDGRVSVVSARNYQQLLQQKRAEMERRNRQTTTIHHPFPLPGGVTLHNSRLVGWDRSSGGRPRGFHLPGYYTPHIDLPIHDEASNAGRLSEGQVPTLEDRKELNDTSHDSSHHYYEATNTSVSGDRPV